MPRRTVAGNWYCLTRTTTTRGMSEYCAIDDLKATKITLHGYSLSSVLISLVVSYVGYIVTMKLFQTRWNPKGKVRQATFLVKHSSMSNNWNHSTATLRVEALDWVLT